ncbi:MAG: peptidoglycan editing factor PgeF [Gammaproteobacteria bacterium]
MSKAGFQFVAPDWRTQRQVSAAMTLRNGGVSSGPFRSLNLGVHVGDEPSAVAENRRRVHEHLGLPSEPVWLEQVHGIAVVDLDSPGGTATGRGAVGSSAGGVSSSGAVGSGSGIGSSGASGWGIGGSSSSGSRGAVDSRAGSTPFRADAVVTRRAGPVCAIQVADCLPVLLSARDGSAIGAAHAGWRGLAGGVIEATVRAMDTDPGRLLAWLGPAIGQPNFEVGDEVRAAFVGHDAQAATAFTQNARARWQCDLYALARLRLAALGVQHVSGGGWDTYAQADEFFSYRREGKCGRMAALIWINP